MMEQLTAFIRYKWVFDIINGNFIKRRKQFAVEIMDSKYFNCRFILGKLFEKPRHESVLTAMGCGFAPPAARRPRLHSFCTEGARTRPRLCGRRDLIWSKNRRPAPPHSPVFAPRGRSHITVSFTSEDNWVWDNNDWTFMVTWLPALSCLYTSQWMSELCSDDKITPRLTWSMAISGPLSFLPVFPIREVWVADTR